MSDSDDDGRRIPDADELEEAYEQRSGRRKLGCPNCGEICAVTYPATRATLEEPGEPLGVKPYGGAVEADSYWFCSEKCLKEYKEE